MDEHGWVQVSLGDCGYVVVGTARPQHDVVQVRSASVTRAQVIPVLGIWSTVHFEAKVELPALHDFSLLQ